MPTFLISDTHFGHPLMAGLRGFSSIDEMDHAFISNWNRVVDEDDEVWHLGDVYICSDKRATEILNQLNGRKHLVLGNHDKPQAGPTEATSRKLDCGKCLGNMVFIVPMSLFTPLVCYYLSTSTGTFIQIRALKGLINAFV